MSNVKGERLLAIQKMLTDGKRLLKKIQSRPHKNTGSRRCLIV